MLVGDRLPMTVVFAEMPEAEGRDLSIERQHLPAAARIENFTYRGDRGALVDACRDADAILTDYVPFDRPVLERLARCRIISVAATGWDCVDVRAAAERGIRVSCVGEYCTEEVADHTLALLLVLNRCCSRIITRCRPAAAGAGMKSKACGASRAKLWV